MTPRRTAKLIKQTFRGERRNHEAARKINDTATMHGIRMYCIGIVGGLLYSCQISDKAFGKITRWILGWAEAPAK